MATAHYMTGDQKPSITEKMGKNYCTYLNCDREITCAATFCWEHSRSIERKCPEYLAAIHLLREHGIITLPSPNQVYDLLAPTLNLRIKIKKPYYKYQIAMTERQLVPGAFDVLMIYIDGNWIYATQAEALSAVDSSTNKRTVPSAIVTTWQERGLHFRDIKKCSPKIHWDDF